MAGVRSRQRETPRPASVPPQPADEGSATPHESDPGPAGGDTIEEEQSEAVLAAQLQATRIRIRQLEELQEAEEKVRSLEQARRRQKKNRGSDDDGSASDGGRHVVKVKNLVTFEGNMTLRKREEWLADLARAFKGEKRKFRSGERRILLALEHMSADYRAKWASHVQDTPEESEAVEEDWDGFVEWSLSLLKEASIREPYLRRSLEKARQKEGQSPREFHTYLDSIEKQLAPKPEQERAYFFFAKLLQSLQDHVNLHADRVPETRKEVVELTERYWTTKHFTDRKRPSGSRGDDGDHDHGSGSNKRHRPSGHAPRPRGPQRPFGSNNPPRADNTPAGDQRPPVDKSKIECYNCHKKGHYAKECRSPRKVQNTTPTAGKAQGSA